MFTLRKIAIDEGKRSMVGVGEGRTQPNMILFKHDGADDDKIWNATLDDLAPGYQVLISGRGFDFLRTSKISEIISRQPDKVIFRTQTSTYELSQTEEPAQAPPTHKE